MIKIDRFSGTQVSRVRAKFLVIEFLNEKQKSLMKDMEEFDSDKQQVLGTLRIAVTLIDDILSEVEEA